MHLGKHVGTLLDVADRQPLVDVLGLQLLASERLELVVVVLRPQDGLLKDRGVRGNAAQRFLSDHARELATLDQRAAYLVQPNAHARIGERLQAGIYLNCRGHFTQASFTLETTSRAVMATCSGVKPMCLCSASAGPGAPNACLPFVVT